jgi:hypothetical protein
VKFDKTFFLFLENMKLQKYKQLSYAQVDGSEEGPNFRRCLE